MQVPLEMTLRDVPHRNEVEDSIRSRVTRLHRFAADIVGCHVTVEQPQRHQRSGSPWRVRIEVHLPPKKYLVVTREPGENDMHTELPTILRHAFEAMERRVKETVRRRRGDVKMHEEPRALVSRIVHDEGYGFIRAGDGQEYYFHRNSVLHNDFERLAVGTEVRFEAEEGEKGPQASTVQIVAKPGRTASEEN